MNKVKLSDIEKAFNEKPKGTHYLNGHCFDFNYNYKFWDLELLHEDEIFIKDLSYIIYTWDCGAFQEPLWYMSSIHNLNKVLEQDDIEIKEIKIIEKDKTK